MLGQRSLEKQDRGLQPNVYLIFGMSLNHLDLQTFLWNSIAPSPPLELDFAKTARKKNLLVFSVLYYLGYEVYSHLIIQH